MQASEEEEEEDNTTHFYQFSVFCEHTCNELDDDDDI